MYIGLKNIQHLFSDSPNLLTNSDGLHCLTGWTKLASAVQPYMNHLLYACTYDDSFSPAGFPLVKEMHLLCIVRPGTDLQEVSEKFPDFLSLLILESDNAENVYSTLQNYFNMQCGGGNEIIVSVKNKNRVLQRSKRMLNGRLQSAVKGKVFL